jgi:RNA polymerase sigma factor (TIGR02999 family)
MNEVTEVLQAIEDGRPQAAEELLPLVYTELRRLAQFKMARELPGQTLQPTALVHEAWLRVASNENRGWDGRAHFFAAAAEAMRRILIENARRKRALKHGGGQVAEELDQVAVAAPAPDEQLLAIDEALERLMAREPQKAELVKLRFFVGLTLEQAAEVLRISEATAKRWWVYARAWLYAELQK